MNSSPPMFQRYVAAVDALQAYLSGRPNLQPQESPLEYSISGKIEIKGNWQDELRVLAEKLRDASFKVRLRVTVGDYQIDCQILNLPGELTATCEPATGAHETISLPAEAVSALDDFKSLTEQSGDPKKDLLLAAVFTAISALTEKGASVEISLRASLSKDQIQPELDSAIVLSKVVYYLFAENLLKDLEAMSFVRFENDFCEPQKRTVIVLFDTSVFLTGEFLVVCGRDHDSQLKDVLIGPVRNEALETTNKTLEFRKSESLGDFHTEWITPDVFALAGNVTEANGGLVKLDRQFKSFQALLSALFLADYVDCSDSTVRVEYRGIGVAKFPIERSVLLAPECSMDALYQLYAYAYEGFSADKLEIVQQFLSLMASSALMLCGKSMEAQEAAKKTYAVVLREKVSVYFDALNKIQDRIKTAVDKSAEGVINLSRDVSADLYKIAGVIAVAIAGALLKPDFGWPVALAASMVIATYLALAIFYHLATLKRAYDLAIEQHTGYIESFDGVLGRHKLDEFLSDPHLKRAKELFAENLMMAEQAYASFLVISLVVVQTSIHKLCTV